MKNKKAYCPVQLELELETIASLWPPIVRLNEAKKLRRWARQLEVSAHVMINRSSSYRKKKSALPMLPLWKAALN